MLENRAGTNVEIYLRSFANKIFEYSKHSVLAFKVQVLQYLLVYSKVLSFPIKFVNIEKLLQSV